MQWICNYFWVRYSFVLIACTLLKAYHIFLLIYYLIEIYLVNTVPPRLHINYIVNNAVWYSLSFRKTQSKIICTIFSVFLTTLIDFVIREQESVLFLSSSLLCGQIYFKTWQIHQPLKLFKISNQSIFTLSRLTKYTI